MNGRKKMTKLEKMELCMWYDANNDEELFNQRITAKDLFNGWW